MEEKLKVDVPHWGSLIESFPAILRWVYEAYRHLLYNEEMILRSLKLSSILTPWLDGLRHKKCKVGEEREIKPWQNCRKVLWWCNLTCKVPTWAFFALLHFWHGRIHKWSSIQRNSNAFYFSLSRLSSKTEQRAWGSILTKFKCTFSSLEVWKHHSLNSVWIPTNFLKSLEIVSSLYIL